MFYSIYSTQYSVVDPHWCDSVLCDSPQAKESCPATCSEPEWCKIADCTTPKALRTRKISCKITRMYWKIRLSILVKLLSEECFKTIIVSHLHNFFLDGSAGNRLMTKYQIPEPNTDETDANDTKETNVEEDLDYDNED